MMTFKEIVNKHLSKEQKDFFAKVFKFETPIITPDNAPTTGANAQETLPDGTVIKSDSPSFVVGSVVTVVTPNGELPAPDGEITLANGTILTVAKGVVTEIENPAEDTTPGAENPAQMASTPDADPSTEARLQALEKAVAELQGSGMKMNSDAESKLAESAKIISALISKFSAIENENKEIKISINKFSDEFAKLLELPIGEPIESEVNHINTKKDKALSIFKK